MSDKKILIIGSGLGSLMCAALLSKQGYKVLVIEKHQQPGGSLQSYSRFGSIFDTGMHVFGGMEPGCNIRRICDYLGITDNFETLPLDKGANMEVYLENERKLYTIDLTEEGIIPSLSAYFPAERENLRRYREDIESIIDEMDLFQLKSAQPKLYKSETFMMAADEFIARQIQDPRLRAILAVINILYSGEKGISPAFLHCVLSIIFLKGACRVTNGYSTFAKALVDKIRANGGEILTGKGVERILSDDSKVTGVTLSDGTDISGDLLINGIQVSKMVDLIGPHKRISRNYREYMQSHADSLSSFLVNIKLKPGTLPFSNRVGFYLKKPESAWSHPGNSISKFMYMTPPVAQQGEFADTISVVLPMDWESVKRWEGTTVGARGEDYLQFKKNMLEQTLDCLENVYPDIRSKILRADTASPLTIRDYIGVRHGAMCGIRKQVDDALPFLPVTTHIPNLFITGQDVNIHGFCGVTLSALQTCEAILGQNYLINQLSKV